MNGGLLDLFAVADLLALLAALAVTRPSLLPRFPAAHLLAVAAAVLLAYLAGSVLWPPVALVLPETGPWQFGAPVVLAAAAAAAVRWAATARSRRVRLLVGVGQLLAVSALAHVALEGVRAVADELRAREGSADWAARFEVLVVLVVVLAATQRLWRHVTRQQELARAYERDSPSALPFAAVTVACLAATALGRTAHSALQREIEDVADRSFVPPAGLTAAAMVLALGVLLGAVVSVVRWWSLRSDLVMDARFVTDVDLPFEVSGHVDAVTRRSSAVPFETLGRAGQEFVSTSSTSGAAGGLVAAHGAPARPRPIRIYVGTRSSQRWHWDPRNKLKADRVQLALAEISRTAALDRAHLLVVVPTGSGWVNPTAVQAFEHASGGDCATVVVQYAVFPSWLAVLLARPAATRLQVDLLAGVARLLEERADAAARSPVEGAGPKTFVYGESLGALIAQEAVLRAGRPRGRAGDGTASRPNRPELEVVRALLVGIPNVERRLQTVRRRNAERLAAGAAAFALGRVTGQADEEQIEEADLVYCTHTDDPVSRLGPTLMAEAPPWLAGRGHLSRSARRAAYQPASPDALRRIEPWWVGVTFCRLLADVLAPSIATKHLEGRAAGHDYRYELPRLVATCLGRPGAVTDADVERMAAQVTGAALDAGLAAGAARVPGQRRDTRRALQPLGRSALDVTELRVHGVGGAPPEHTLNHPVADQVAGDRTAGFYRCGPREDRPSAPELRRREAYAWGGLTSGAGHGVLWVLVLPFTLLNVAHWMTPHQSASKLPRAATWIAATQRLVALTMTLAFVLTWYGVGTIAGGWSCVADRCAGTKDWLVQDLRVPGVGALDVGLPEVPGERMVVTGLAPVVALAVLWWLSTVSRVRYERWPAASRPRTGPGVSVGLSDRDFWRGRVPVERLQLLHTSAALGLVTVLMAYTALRAQSASAVAPVLQVLLGAGGVLVVVTAVLVRSHRVAGRPDQVSRPTARGPVADEGGGWTAALQLMAILAVGLIVATALVVALSWREEPSLVGAPPLSFLPGYGGALIGVFYGQVLLLVVLGLALVPAWRAGRRSSTPAGYEPVAGGFAPVVVTGLAAVVAGALSAGLLLVTVRLTSTSTFGGGTGGLELPGLVEQGAVAVVFGIGGFLLALAVLLLGRRLRAGQIAGEVLAAYGVGGPTGIPAGETEQPWAARRRAQIARTQATGWLVDRIFRAAVTAVLCAAVGLVLALPVGISGRGLPEEWQTRVVEACLLVVASGTTVLLGFTYTALRDRSRRRLIGVLWDVCTFWPRAAHPFGAPCYAERAVPDLVTRIEALTQPRHPDTFPYASAGVVLVGYSQGAILAIAAVAQLEGDGRPDDDGALDRLALLTCASPHRRLYARCFPAYFRASELAVGPARAAGARPAADVRPPAQSLHDGAGASLGQLADQQLWRNVYRPTDFIGSWVRRPVVPGRPDDAGVDRVILDPRTFAPPVGDLAMPRIEAHGGYLADAELLEEIRKLTDALRRHLGLSGTSAFDAGDAASGRWARWWPLRQHPGRQILWARASRKTASTSAGSREVYAEPPVTRAISRRGASSPSRP